MTIWFLLLVAGGALLLLAGFAGSILPVLPGPPLGFAAILLLWGACGWEARTFGLTTVVVIGAASLLVTAVDFLTPIWGAKRFGASRAGIWGSVAGMLAGLVWFPPLGSILGAFAGALAGEAVAGKSGTPALRAAWGVFVGTMIGMILKLAVCGVIAYIYVKELLA